MGFSKNKSNSKGSDGSKAFRTVGSIWNRKDDDDKFLLRVDDFAGELFFVDKETDVAYRVKVMNLIVPRKPRDSGKSLPKNLHYNVTINLDNEGSVEPVPSDN